MVIGRARGGCLLTNGLFRNSTHGFAMALYYTARTTTRPRKGTVLPKSPAFPGVAKSRVGWKTLGQEWKGRARYGMARGKGGEREREGWKMKGYLDLCANMITYQRVPTRSSTVSKYHPKKKSKKLVLARNQRPKKTKHCPRYEKSERCGGI